MIIVDTHAHIYHADEVKYPKKESPLRPPEATGGIEHLRREAKENGVEKVVLVQTGSAYRWDNRLLADTAAANRDWTVGVCTLDPSAEASVDELKRLVRRFNVKGLRLEPSAEPSPRYYHEGARRLWAAAGEVGAVICAHLRLDFLEELARLLAEFPQVPVVLDHCAYPAVDEGGKTASAVVKLSAFSQLYAKLTFGVTASAQEYPFADTHDLLKEMIKAFGAERCMWGSDFPCELWLKKSTYAQHLAVFSQELGLDLAQREAVLGTTAARLWFGA